MLLCACLFLTSCSLISFGNDPAETKPPADTTPVSGTSSTETPPVQDTPAPDSAPVEPSAVGLSYLANYGENTCTIVGIGTCKETAIVIPQTIDGLTVVSIGQNAFADCKDVVSITLPDTLKTIEDGAFRGCILLKTITIPQGVERICPDAFTECSKLISATFVSPDGWKTVEDMKSLTLTDAQNAAELLRLLNDVTWVKEG